MAAPYGERERIAIPRNEVSPSVLERPFVPHVNASITQLQHPTQGLSIQLSPKPLVYAPSLIPPDERERLEGIKKAQEKELGYWDDPKLELLNPSFNPATGIITADPARTSYGWWMLHSQEYPEAGRSTSASVLWLTTEPDGSHMVVMAQKSSRNHSYREMLVSGASGNVELTLAEDNETVKETLSPKLIRDTALRETMEEIGLPRGVIQAAATTTIPQKDGMPNFQLTSLITANGHTDAVYVGTLPVSAADIRSYQQQLLGGKLAADEREPIDPSVFIKIEDIPTLLSQHLTPLHAPTLMGLLDINFLNTYQKAQTSGVAEEQAQQIARQEYQALHQRALAELEVMEHTAAQTAREQGREDRYAETVSPYLLPEDQGLLSARAALKELGIYHEVSPSFTSPEVDIDSPLYQRLQTIYSNVQGEAPFFIEQKVANLWVFFTKHPEYMGVFSFYEAGDLLKTPDTYNIARHNLTAMLYADVFCDLFDIPQEERAAIVFTAGIHDFAKITERDFFKEQLAKNGKLTPDDIYSAEHAEKSTAESILPHLPFAPHTAAVLEILGSNVPKITEGKVDPSTWTLGQQIMWLVDAMLYDEKMMPPEMRFGKDRRGIQRHGEHRGTLAEYRDKAMEKIYGMPYRELQILVGKKLFAEYALLLRQKRDEQGEALFSTPQVSDLTALVKGIYNDRICQTNTPIQPATAA